MIVRGLDANHDWTFGNGKQDYRINELCIEQNCKTRILSFLGDCFFDTEAGIDWWNLLGYGTKKALLTSLRATIINTDGVVGINSIETELIDRKLKITYNIKTQFSSSYQSEVNLTTSI